MTGTDIPAPLSTRHVAPLDGIRGLAVLIVVIHNSAWIAGASQQLLLKLTIAITAAGWIGVQIFFALSGFLITGILLDSTGKPRYFRSFYLRRTLRIFPLYFIFIGAVFILGPLVAWSPDWVASVRQHQWPYWVYLSNWFSPFKLGVDGMAHLWSLAVEEQFYLMWPLVVYTASRRRLTRLCAVVMVGTPVVRYVMLRLGLPGDAAYHFTFARWDALAAGALLALLLREESGRALVARWNGRVAVVAAFALAILVVVQHGFHANEMPNQVLGQSLIAILSVNTLALAVAEGHHARGRFQTFLSRPSLRMLGKYSYAMYIFHFPIHQALAYFVADTVSGADTPWRFLRVIAYVLFVLTLSFVAALASWRLIEHPFLRLKDRVAPRAG